MHGGGCVSSEGPVKQTPVSSAAVRKFLHIKQHKSLSCTALREPLSRAEQQDAQRLAKEDLQNLIGYPDLEELFAPAL